MLLSFFFKENKLLSLNYVWHDIYMLHMVKHLSVSNSLLQTRIPVYIHEHPAGTSIKNMLHYSQVSKHAIYLCKC